MNSDAHFVIGTSHRVCEDYAIAGNCENRGPYAIVSDGCSSSSNTDIGARLLAHSAKLAIERTQSFYSEGVIWQAAGVTNAVGLPHTCLDATLLAIYMNDVHGEQGCRIYAAGDGVLAARNRHEPDKWWVASINFSCEAPGYLRYLLDKKWTQEFFDIDGGAIRTVEFSDFVDGELSPSHSLTQDLRLMPVDRWSYSPTILTDVFDLVLVMSDGIRSIQDQSGNPMPLEETVSRLLRFKGLNGEFVTRRMNRFLRDLERDGYAPSDDLSIGGVHLEEIT